MSPGYLSEKSLRVSTEFRLNELEEAPKQKGPGSVVSSKAAFNNLGMTDDLKREIDTVVKLGQQERWILKEGVVVDESSVLGRGGFGYVCAARLHGTPTVVKLPNAPMHAWVGRGASHLRALGNEIRFLRRLRHPNIVLFHGAVMLGGEEPTGDAPHGDEQPAPSPMRLGLVLEWVEGSMLRSFAHSHDAASLFFVAIDVCRALRFLHAQEPAIVHGDLKPGNIMVQETAKRPRAKIIDFGLARMVTPDAAPPGGTRHWVSPEQVLDPKIKPTEKLDIFSFGSVVYYMELGKPPMADVSKQSKVLQDAAARLPWSAGPNSWTFLSKEAREDIHACLTVGPQFRPASLDRVQAALEDCMPSPLQQGFHAKLRAGSRRSSSSPLSRMPALPEEDVAFMQGETTKAQDSKVLLETKPWMLQVSALDLLCRWHRGTASASCCRFHVLAESLQDVVADFQQSKCKSLPGCYEMQCPVCGLLGEDEGGSFVCGMCGAGAQEPTSLASTDRPGQRRQPEPASLDGAAEPTCLDGAAEREPPPDAEHGSPGGAESSSGTAFL